MTHDRYRLIYADPPWQYRDKRQGRGGAEGHYRTLPLDEIGATITRHAAENCNLALWQTWPMEREQDDLLSGLGWKKIGLLFIWVKTTATGREAFGGGLAGTRANTEPCFLWRRGRGLKRASAGEREILVAPQRAHSAKPDEARERLERLYPVEDRIELFARGAAPYGWDVYGDQVEPTEDRTEHNPEEATC